jgi:hypothetical protein
MKNVAHAIFFFFLSILLAPLSGSYKKKVRVPDYRLLEHHRGNAVDK